MKLKTLVVRAVITAFVFAIAFVVVRAYRQMTAPPDRLLELQAAQKIRDRVEADNALMNAEIALEMDLRQKYHGVGSGLKGCGSPIPYKDELARVALLRKDDFTQVFGVYSGKYGKDIKAVLYVGVPATATTEGETLFLFLKETDTGYCVVSAIGSWGPDNTLLSGLRSMYETVAE